MKLMLFIFPMFFCLGVFAQQKTVTGTVTSKELQSPLPGVTVKSSQQVVTTGKSGEFTITARVNESITFSYIGMKTASVLITNSQEPLAFSMEYETGSLNEIVVTGYQAQKKADLTGAVSVVKTAEIKDIPLGNPIKALQGRIPGVFITTNGSPASDATVRIRGIGTLGNNNPLYVIDGIPTERGLNEINQADIESMQVLKDASAATIYGSRAANGVIIITTKKGKKGVSKIDVNSSISTQNYRTKIQVLNTDERGRAVWQAAINDGTDPNTASQIYKFETGNQNGKPVLNKVILPEYLDAAKTMRPADTKWFNEISQTSLIKNNDITISNGSEKGSSLFSVSYYDNTGIIRGSSLKRLTTRANTEYRMFNDRLVVGENLSFTHSVGTAVPAEDIVGLSLQAQPIVPVHTIDGGWGGPAPGMTDRQNPVRLIEDNRQNKSHFYRLFGNAYAALKITPDLVLKSSIGVDYSGNYARTLRKSYVSGFLTDPSNQVRTSQDYSGNWVWQNTLNYNKVFGESAIEALLGSEQIQFMSQNFFGSRQGYALENIDYAYLDAGSSNKDNGGSGANNSLMSFFGKVNYAYKARYLASATIRRDGSSRFGADNRYAYFPAFSLGWRLSEEGFIKNNMPFVSDLKLRYGWGKTGNQAIANNAIYDLYSAIYGTDPTWDRDRGSAYDINGGNSGQLPSGFTKTQRGNNTLKWESTTQSNFGIDFGFLQQKISGSVDYFIKNTADILLTPPSLAVIGEGGDPTVNGASMSNKGFEGVINYDGKIGRELRFSISANVATYRNKITKLPENSLTAFPGNGNDKIIINRSVSSYFGYVADGIFQDQGEVDKHATQNGKGVGRIRYKDLNNDGIINGADRDYIGTSDPDFTYGLNISASYKNFDISIFFQGVQGVMVNNSSKIYTDFSSLWPGTNWGKRTLDAWTPQNTGASIPALTLVDRNDEGRFSTYYLEPGSYLRLRNVQIGYDLTSLANKISIKRARFFLQGSNLLTWKSSRYTGPDPEAPNSTFPIPSIYTAGLNITL
ncbi:SusC/RagA family TonB-linked outer membrane protein [Chitinophaga arvensicola]|uniref:TonB-linked outer membrane protein, SusC/RagA family n=1 Tax=Chitinophaga arvensicola TaxID=29529 RepID=A0A1I0S7Q5_9BACT|nr:TonB-dependent receptor [Chitinophaga arvensicola]SEW51847.1 TonB-linked outer membrane protein, SusC/RagA family [Chitinophaga arvensicola]